MMRFPEFITALQRLGVTVPGAELLTVPAQVPAMIDGSFRRPLLGLTAAELAAETERVAAARVLNTSTARGGGGYPSLLHDMQTIYEDEFKDALRRHADSLIEQLRATFDPAADAARRVAALGISPSATVETLFTAPEEHRRAWLEFKGKHTATLEHVFRIRQAMTKHLRIPPQHEGKEAWGRNPETVEWGLAVTRPTPGTTGSTPFAADSAAPHRRWLEHADRLYLPTVAELQPSAVAHAAGLPVDKLLKEARRRAAAGLAVDELEGSDTDTVDLGDEYLARYGERNPA